jgi:hypothetical protein
MKSVSILMFKLKPWRVTSSLVVDRVCQKPKLTKLYLQLGLFLHCRDKTVHFGDYSIQDYRYTLFTTNAEVVGFCEISHVISISYLGIGGSYRRPPL